MQCHNYQLFKDFFLRLFFRAKVLIAMNYPARKTKEYFFFVKNDTEVWQC